MPAEVTAWPVYRKLCPAQPGDAVVTTVSNAEGIWSGLSPFKIGPCKLYGKYVSRNMENAWQYSKVYHEFLDGRGRVSAAYYKWAKEGWRDVFAHRYPMGKGRRPEFSLWDGKQLGYVEARKQIYGPLYAEAVMKTEAWTALKELFETKKRLLLLDYDAYDHRALNDSLTQVLNNPYRKMGHAFVLAMLLTGDKALNEMAMR